MHGPSAYRDILRRLKASEDPRIVLADARKIEDPAWAAEAVLACSSDNGLQFDEARHGVKVAKQLAKQIERLGRRGEVYAAFAKAAASWRPGARNPQAEPTRQSLIDIAVDGILAMPDGEWTQQAIDAAARHVGPAGRQKLLGRALGNAGFEAAGAKAVLRAADQDRPGLELLLADAAPEVKAAALADDHALEAAWAIEDPTKRAEALRVLVWKEDDPQALRHIAGSAEHKDPQDFVRLHTQVGGRLDKLGHDPHAVFAAARSGLKRLEGRAAARLEAKLYEAEARAGNDGPQPPTRQRTPRPEPATGGATPVGHTLALVNTYQGGLKKPHLQSAARAAPLCWAFGLDLALVDFPAADLDGLIEAAQAETGIGDGVGYLRRLHAAGRIHAALPEGTLVATTPTPDPDKLFDPASAPRHVVMAMGVGPQGLPTRILHEAAHHYEVTGLGVSLETATAMGILADRLGRL